MWNLNKSFQQFYIVLNFLLCKLMSSSDKYPTIKWFQARLKVTTQILTEPRQPSSRKQKTVKEDVPLFSFWIAKSSSADVWSHSSYILAELLLCRQFVFKMYSSISPTVYLNNEVDFSWVNESHVAPVMVGGWKTFESFQNFKHLFE